LERIGVVAASPRHRREGLPSVREIPPPPAARRRPRPLGLAAPLITVAGIAWWLVLCPLDRNDLIGDEGYYGTMARNMLARPADLVGPSLTPLGEPGDKPPLYPALLAVSIAALGPTAPALRWPSILLAALIVLATAALAARAAPAPARLATAALLVALPAFADASRFAQAETPVTALGALALLIACRPRAGARDGALAGVLLGLAFLCKLWLAGVFVLAALLALAPWRRAGRAPAAALLAAAAATGALQLVAVAIAHRSELAHWWEVTWGFSLLSRLGGEGYEESWRQPVGYYVTVLLHHFAALVPLIALGLQSALRRRGEPAARALLGWCLGTALLSLFAVKSAGYSYLVLPAWTALAAIGLQALGAGERLRWPAAVLAAVLSVPTRATFPTGLPAAFALWAGGWIALLAVTAIGARRPALLPRLTLALGAGVLAIGLLREAQRLPQPHNRAGLREAAEVIAPALAGVPPARVAYLAPQAPALAYYTFRSGSYWDLRSDPWSPARRARVMADTALRAFVVDPTRSLQRGWPDSLTLAWLVRSSREVTGEVERRAGHPVPIRVFVREARHPAAAHQGSPGGHQRRAAPRPRRPG
jgi:4-amino-4-deoxy-L-arabinose transferase-like glycosyltransferase